MTLYSTSTSTSTESLESPRPPLARVQCDSPVTSVCWGQGGRKAFIASTSGAISEIDMENRSLNDIGHKHQLGVQSLVSLGSTSSSLLVSGSWDRSIQYIDSRTGSTTQTVTNLPGKIFAMDSTPNGDKLVVAMSNRLVHVYDVRNSLEPLQIRESGLKYQTKDLKCMPNGEGYAQSSIEGRVAIEYFDPSETSQSRKYAFKCHRLAASDMDLVSPVNSLTFHGSYGTLFTAGADGHVCLWDHQSKKRLRQYSKLDQSVVSLDFDDKDGQAIIAIATSDDSFKTAPSIDSASSPMRSKIFIRALAENEGAPRVKNH